MSEANNESENEGQTSAAEDFIESFYNELNIDIPVHVSRLNIGLDVVASA